MLRVTCTASPSTSKGRPFTAPMIRPMMSGRFSSEGLTSSTRTCGGVVRTLTRSVFPAAGSRFAGWSGGGCSGTGACRVTVNGAVGVTATFSPSSSGPSQPSGGSGSQPDLVVTGLSVPSSVARNSGFTMLFNVLNQGRAPASSLQLRIYLSRDSRLSSDDVLLRARTFGAIPAGGTVANAITETIPSGTGTGAYYLLLVVDAAGVVSESSESNNTLTRAVTVR
jgi:CARDB